MLILLAQCLDMCKTRTRRHASLQPASCASGGTSSSAGRLEDPEDLEVSRSCGWWETNVGVAANAINLPFGKRLTVENLRAVFMGKLTVSMAVFNNYVKLPEGTIWEELYHPFLVLLGMV